MLSSLLVPPEVEATVLGGNGFVGLAKGAAYVDLSTNSPTVVRKLAEARTAPDFRIPNVRITHGTPVPDVGWPASLCLDSRISHIRMTGRVMITGGQHGYHPARYGYLFGAPIFCITHFTSRTFLYQELIDSVGIGFHIGAPETFGSRIVELVASLPPAYATPDSLVALAGKSKYPVANVAANPAVSSQMVNIAKW